MVKTSVQSGIHSRYIMRSLPIIVSALAGAVLFSAAPTVAQSTNADNLPRAGSSDQDPNAFGDTGLDMFELIHRAQQGAIRNPYEFSQDQQNNINSEADNFRMRQQEALEQRSGNPAPVTVPTVQPESE
jgi:hypothetical protein